MCGICGIIYFDKKPVSAEELKNMTDAIAHRGPDGEGHWINNYVGLGHRRLSILDLSSAGNQPMQTANQRFIISYNGEIYNFNEIRKELEELGYKFKSGTDTEVVLNAFAQWNEKSISKLNGMFAFAIWDQEKREMTLVRDRYGIKPLYFIQTDKFLLFSSEIKAILTHKEVQPEIDRYALIEYLTFQNFFTDRTLFKDIKILSPGHHLKVKESGAFEKIKYWDFEFNDTMLIKEKDAEAELDFLFRRAVNRQLVSDVPVNTYLSGGIDSGAITMVASEILDELKTFTIGFDLSSASELELLFDERTKAEHISYLAQSEHYEMVLKAGDMQRCMEEYVYHLEEPRVGQSYPNYYAAKLASKFGKVVLSGCGGDELFGGYPWRYMYSNKKCSYEEFIDAYFVKWQRLFEKNSIKKLLNGMDEVFDKIETREIFSDIFKDFPKKNLSPQDCTNLSFYFEAKTFLHGLLVVEDKISMAHSLETRVPFLDNDLVDFSLKLPNKFKVSQPEIFADENDILAKKSGYSKNGKLLLRNVFAKYVGENVSKRRKQGFSSPDAAWFRQESINYVKNVFNNSPSVFNKDYLQKILKDHMCSLTNNRLKIWSILYLSEFFKSKMIT